MTSMLPHSALMTTGDPIPNFTFTRFRKDDGARYFGPFANLHSIRHALDVDATGERLAFGSTTGSLWVTENGGQTWSTVSEHLPPVHAVSF